jgi:ABC-type branched-subunit amino acid transport system substrate-binding protein
MSHNVRRRDVVKGLGAAGTIAIAGCTGGGGGGGGSRTLSQGVLMPLSGGLGNLGQPIRDGAILPFRLLDGETDFTIDNQVEDTQTDPNAGQTAAQSLVDAGYPAVTGAASSEVTIQVAENVFIPNDVVGCSPASTSPAITDLEDKNLIWRTPPTDALQGQVMAQVATERRRRRCTSTTPTASCSRRASRRPSAGTYRIRCRSPRARVPTAHS